MRCCGKRRRQTECVGLPDRTDWAWQPIRERHEDTPDQLEIFSLEVQEEKTGEKRESLETNSSHYT